MIKTSIIQKLNFFYSFYRELLFVTVIVCLLISLSLQSIDFMQSAYVLTHSDDVSQVSVRSATKNTLMRNNFLPLFGKADEKKQFIPATSLNLKLKGVLAGIDQATSSAIIQGADGLDKLYKQGEKLPGGATLEKVEPNSVIIRHLGSLQKIFFSEKPGDPTLATPGNRYGQPVTADNGDLEKRLYRRQGSTADFATLDDEAKKHDKMHYSASRFNQHK